MSGKDDKAGQSAGDKTGKAADAVLDDFWNEAVEEASAALQSDSAEPDDELPPAPPPDDEVLSVLASADGGFEPLTDPLAAGDAAGFEDVILDADVLSELGPHDGEILDGEILDGEILDGDALEEILDGEVLESETVEEIDVSVDVAVEEPVEEVLDAEFVAGEVTVTPPTPTDDAESPVEPPVEKAEPSKPAPADDGKRSPVAMLLVLAALVVIVGGVWKFTQPDGDPPILEKPVVVRDDPGEFVEDKPVEDKPVEDKPVEDKPVEDKPVEDKPVEDKPVEDKPVEDKPVEDKPVEDKPVEDKPVEDKPAAAGLAGLIQGKGVTVGRSRNVAKEGSEPVDAELRRSLVKALKRAGYSVGREGAYIRPYLTAFSEGTSSARVQCAVRVQASKKAKVYERFKGKARSAANDPVELAEKCAESVVAAVKAQLPPK